MEASFLACLHCLWKMRVLHLFIGRQVLFDDLPCHIVPISIFVEEDLAVQKDFSSFFPFNAFFCYVGNAAARIFAEESDGKSTLLTSYGESDGAGCRVGKFYGVRRKLGCAGCIFGRKYILGTVVCRAVKFADVGIGFGIIVVSVKFDFIYRNSFGQFDDVFYSGRIFDAFDGREPVA